MKYDTANLVIVNSNIVTVVYVICAFVSAIVAVCLKVPQWAWLFVGTAVIVSLTQILLCAFRYKGSPNNGSSEESK